MIITRERLIELAEREAEKRGERRGLLAAYVVGSVATGDPIFAGSADVDVVMIHPDPPLRDREIVVLSPDVHLDLYHYDRSRFGQPRELRVDPDLGPSLCQAVRVFDPDHFFDWVQAGACAQFDLPDQRVTRGRNLLSRARDMRASLRPDPVAAVRFVTAALDGANAAMMVSGLPCSGRRVIPNLRARFELVERLDLFRHLIELFNVDQADSSKVADWIAQWAKGYDRRMSEGEDPLMQPARRDYFLRAFHELADSGQPEAIMPLLILHWPGMSAKGARPAELPEHSEAYLDLLAMADLTPDRLVARKHDLEATLDHMELFLEDWAERHGA
ncbi:MAG: hypothetical protein WBR18_00825 [Anaerolineales bacterium]